MGAKTKLFSHNFCNFSSNFVGRIFEEIFIFEKKLFFLASWGPHFGHVKNHAPKRPKKSFFSKNHNIMLNAIAKPFKGPLKTSTVVHPSKYFSRTAKSFCKRESAELRVSMPKRYLKYEMTTASNYFVLIVLDVNNAARTCLWKMIFAKKKFLVNVTVLLLVA